MDLQNGVDHSVLLDFTNDMAILSAALKRKRHFHLTEEEENAFLRITQTELTMLVHPDWSKPFRVHTDASGHSISSILSQDHGIIAHAGRKLSEREQKRAI